MNIFLIIAIILANAIAVTIVYQILKKQPKKEVLIFIAASVTIIYIVVSIVYWLSGFGIDSEVHESSKNFIIYLFVPVNVILFIPYIAVQYKKVRQNKKLEKYDIEKLSTKVAIVVVIFLIALIGQFFYFKNIQYNIKDISDSNKKITNTRIYTDDIKTTNENTNTNTNINTNTTNSVVENSSNIISNEVVNQVNEV